MHLELEEIGPLGDVFGDDLEEAFLERLRTFLDRYATYTGSDPRRAPAALAAVPYAEQAFGGWYVRGGLHRLGLAQLGAPELASVPEAGPA